MVTAGAGPAGAESSGGAPAIEYRIDADDRVVSVNDAYVADVRTHDPSGIDASTHVATAVMGRVLWELLPQAAEWYRPLVRLARVEARTIAFAFRCDTPTLRRLMEMRIEAEADGIVRFVSTLIGQQPRHAVHLLLDGIPRGTALVRMCSWCKRVKAGADWLEVEAAVSRLRVPEAEPMPAITHGICESCKFGLTDLATSPDGRLDIALPSNG